jgi:ABC-2 type transport system ATP-binding protein
MNIIETHNLSRRFGRTEAVHDLDFNVPQGSVCALLGPNGAGKSTTIKVLMNLLPPTGGEAHVMGVDSRRLGPAELANIGYVAESQKLPLWMTVRQYLEFCRPFYPRWDAALAAKLLAMFELPGNRKLAHLSRGMVMKAALLSSLAYRPPLLVLDEPFSGLDPLVRDEFVRGMLEISELGEWTVLVSSHDIEEVERLCDRVAVLQAGRLQFNQTSDELVGRFRRVELTGVTNGTAAPGWLEWNQAGALTTFVDPAYTGDGSERAWRERFAGAAVSSSPMTLREIYLALARAERAAKKEAA